MSASEVDRIINKLDGICERVASLETTVKNLDSKVDKYNGLKDKVFALESDKHLSDEALKQHQENCKAIQAAKAKRLQPWIALAFTVMGGVILILAGIVINIMLNR
jgi:hypothetical protein